MLFVWNAQEVEFAVAFGLDTTPRQLVSHDGVTIDLVILVHASVMLLECIGVEHAEQNLKYPKWVVCSRNNRVLAFCSFPSQPSSMRSSLSCKQIMRMFIFFKAQKKWQKCGSNKRQIGRFALFAAFVDFSNANNYLNCLFIKVLLHVTIFIP